MTQAETREIWKARVASPSMLAPLYRQEQQFAQLADSKNPQELDKLLPWSPSLPLTCRVFTKL